MATVTGTAGNDFIHVAGDGLVAPGGYTDEPNATAGNDVITQGAGNDFVYAGGGDDQINLSPGDLTSADTIDGGTGFDTLLLDNGNTAFTLAAGDFANVSHIESIVVQARFHGSPVNITLSNALVASSDDSHQLTVYIYDQHTPDYSTVATVDASAVTDPANSVHFIVDQPPPSFISHENSAQFTMTGGAGADIFQMGSSVNGIPALSSFVTINGGTGASIDTLDITFPDAYDASAFSGVSHIETLQLSGGQNSVTIPDALVASSDNNHTLTIIGGPTLDTIDASAVTAANSVIVDSGGGVDTLTGGAGADTFKFFIADLTSADTVNGGTGAAIDTLSFKDAGTIGGSIFAGVTHIEAIQLADGTNTITVPDALIGSTDDGHLLTVLGGAGNDTIDASGVVTAGNTVALYGGDGADTFGFTLPDFSSADIVDGGSDASNDTLVFGETGTLAAGVFANVSHIETIQLANGGANAIALSDAVVGASDYAPLGAQVLTVVGGSGTNFVDASAVTTNLHGVIFDAGPGNDTMIGGFGDDTMNAGAGNDVYTYTGGYQNGGLDTVNGGAGTATVDMSQFGSAIFFGPDSQGVMDVSTRDDGNLTAGSWRTLVTTTGVEKVVGTLYNDQINGDAGNNTYVYTGGLHTGGADSFNGGAGSDTVDMSQFGAAIFWGPDSQGVMDVSTRDDGNLTAGSWRTIVTTSSVENVVGTLYNDQINGDAGDNTYTYTGGMHTGGSDTFNGGAGSDTVDMSQFGAAVFWGPDSQGVMDIATRDDTNLTSGSWRTLVTTTGVENAIGSSFNDQINGDSGANRITGGLGADQLNGGGGGDTFVYGVSAESTSTGYDTITGFDAAADKFDFAFSVTGVDATVASGSLSTASFDANLASAVGAGQLAGHHAVLFDPTSGDLAGHTFLVVDANGVAGYQAGQDFVVALASPLHLSSLGTGDFV
ncbi:MAG TPA: calcium-binding protein [Rhizomicrobium sp.]|jgi:Ca2+-binding RTX toxin-like protein|nr:calcium-binding protein [Rhizomicrobium sp.]